MYRKWWTEQNSKKKFCILRIWNKSLKISKLGSRTCKGSLKVVWNFCKRYMSLHRLDDLSSKSNTMAQFIFFHCKGCLLCVEASASEYLLHQQACGSWVWLGSLLPYCPYWVTKCISATKQRVARFGHMRLCPRVVLCYLSVHLLSVSAISPHSLWQLQLLSDHVRTFCKVSVLVSFWIPFYSCSIGFVRLIGTDKPCYLSISHF